MRKVLYLSLKEFRTAQKRQLDGDGPTNLNGEFRAINKTIMMSQLIYNDGHKRSVQAT